ncbi:unnamed protein product, partial [Mesorhabditis belari]|uniref:WAP domain-containing protein n=1 Tax=Mesorhabditis belari TaxID=2138241 RepID=A0AAF3EZC2_9BILA
MISNIAILISTITITVQGATMEWCDYWRLRGVSRSECIPLQWSIQKNYQHRQPIESHAASIPLCHVVTRVSQCAKTGFCASGLLCWVGGQPCCANQKLQNRQVGAPGLMNGGQCPAPDDLNVVCRQKTTVSWCNLDRDCHMTSTMHKCCPTPCGYNMCVPSRQPVDLITRMSSLSIVPTQCPPLDEVPIWCRNPSNSGTSWCNSHNECRQTSMHTRLCCPTRCGYNVCLLKLPNKFIIA